ncbi:glycosyltransferase family 9 protein [Mitsuaria sp. GD03876]|uniref:glycosyltransferase family 9 protein n=1 Tax=Mitsuaria sp. GD03876 TaxID=2975399 RepID=UPI0024481FFD|nr:glycosyltransferase family 9 protein [Mitsuaria sp. GD03876]MDH0866076.1 glycosyl transferase [Mitsuaria sp. GD03876]
MIATSLEQRARPPSPPGPDEAGVPVFEGPAPLDARLLAEERHRRWCNVRRVLLVRLDGVAGVLASTAAFAALHETMPWTHRTLLAAPEALVLRPHLQSVDDVMSFNAPWTASGAAALNAEPSTMRGDAEMHLVRKLRRSHFDAAVLFCPSAQSALPAALLCRMAGIPLTLAHVREPAHGLLSDEVADDGAAHDDTRRQLDLVDHIGMQTADERPRLRLLPKDSHQMRNALQQAGLGFGQRYVLVCPGGGGARHCPAAAFAAAADVLLDAWADDTAVVLCARPGDEAALAELRAAMPARGQVLPPVASIGELAALMASARVLIAVDDLPLTIAAATRVPAVLPGEALRRERLLG